MKHVARNALALACLAIGAGPALAGAYGSATIGNVTVTVIDLDANDGVAAGITFLPSPDKFDGGANLNGEAVNGPQFGSGPGIVIESFNSTSAWQASNLQASAQSGLAHVSGSVTGASTGVGFTSATLEGAAGSSATEHGHFRLSAYIPGYLSGLDYVLAPNTQVVFSMDAALSAATTIGGVDGAQGDTVSVMAGLFARAVDANGAVLDEDRQERILRIGYADSLLTLGADSWDGVLTASFSNLGNQESAGQFAAYVEIEGDSVLSPVPEPSTWALLLGGLGLVGARLRRRVEVTFLSEKS